MAKIKLSEKKIQELKDVCKTFNNDKGELINVLHKAQSLFGYLPAELQEGSAPAEQEDAPGTLPDSLEALGWL